MQSLEQLAFAQHFPFTSSAKKIVAEQSLSLEELPEPLIERAATLARSAFFGKSYAFELHSTDLLLQELLAFPVAKIIVSAVNDPVLMQRFSAMIADSAYNFLKNEKNAQQAAIALATDLGIKFDFPEEKQFLVSMPLQEFLGIPFRDNSLKLVNQFVSHGIVFLDLNGFCRFLREKSFATVLSSLPVPTKGLPKRLLSAAGSLKSETRALNEKLFQEAFLGKVAPEAFPECMASMYSRLAAGQKISHMGNFSLATFLNRIGMPKQQILALFKKAPNFNEKIASYQVSRIAKQNYTPPSCEKIRSYGLCPNPNCKTRHPLSFYKMAIKAKQAQKPLKEKEAS
jgi:DNA primase large subunit